MRSGGTPQGVDGPAAENIRGAVDAAARGDGAPKRQQPQNHVGNVFGRADGRRQLRPGQWAVAAQNGQHVGLQLSDSYGHGDGHETIVAAGDRTHRCAPVAAGLRMEAADG